MQRCYTPGMRAEPLSLRLEVDPPFPSDVASTERYLGIVSRRLAQAIANHEFTKARYYKEQDRKARALLAELSN